MDRDIDKRGISEPMTLLERMGEYVEWKLGTDESHYDEWWSQSGFLRQLMDIYPEAYRLLGCSNEGELRLQWGVFDEFCNQTYADPNVDRCEKEELAEAVEILREPLGGVRWIAKSPPVG